MKTIKNTKRASDFKESIVPDKYKDFDRLQMYDDQFKVSGDGVFYTIQGEGISMGLPSCFLRLHTCNLRCVWCDTWYTWNQNAKEFWTEFQDWTIQKTKARIEKTWRCKNPLVQKRLVITGGEPLIQKNKIDKLVELMPGWAFEV
ncbi:7-carboxy-7-deazaguanine synthase QueE [Candidatus Roizmanbacteria bacterium]|nr:7-carboxy-7-deazaguanine synthase QueE [Candidatus Roizmanbacteria bacterium]